MSIYTRTLTADFDLIIVTKLFDTTIFKFHS